MIRATTPKHIFVFEEDPENTFKTILITYSQNGQIILEKTKDNLEFTSFIENKKTLYSASYRLTQEETKKFESKPRNMIDVQIRVLTYSGEALASDKKSIQVQDVLNDEVLV